MTAPGWYVDAQNPQLVRWWDGAMWTAHTQVRAPAPASSPVRHVAPVVQQPQSSLQANAPSGELEALRRECAALRQQVAALQGYEQLQDIGLYAFAHPLDNAAAYKDRLEALRVQLVAMAKADKAILAATSFALNGSAAEGVKMVTDWKKLVLRAYNNEADNAVRTMKAYGYEKGLKRLEQSRDTIAKLGIRMQIRIAEPYHALRAEELRLTSDYLAKLADEREADKEHRARLREEERVQRELEKKKELLTTEKNKVELAIAKLEAKGDTDAAERMKEKLVEIDAAIVDTAKRAANTRAGFVYVISNRGAFGETVVKIGMTRRENWQDRVDELGDASVPFRFDVHAAIYSDDALGLETQLHARFASRRVNRVNLRREFFYVSPIEVKAALLETTSDLLEFNEAAEALEWAQSEAARNNNQSSST